MSPNKYLYKKFYNILQEECDIEVVFYENGDYFTLGETGFWSSVDEKELTIGFDFNHRHFNFEFDSIEDAVDHFFLILTKRKIVTDYSKGSRIFKTKIEIEIHQDKVLDFGTTIIFSFKFWKKTKINKTIVAPFVNEQKVINQWKELINYAQKDH